MTQKNKILLVTGIGDTYFDPNSDKRLEYGSELADKIVNMLDSVKEKNLYKGFINLTGFYDTTNVVDVFKNIKQKSKIINYKLFNPYLFDSWNTYTLVENTNEKVDYIAKSLDHVISPEHYEVHICGVDLNGFYKDIITELLNKGYTVYLYSDLIKRFKNTELSINSIKNRNFNYCSYRSVKSK